MLSHINLTNNNKINNVADASLYFRHYLTSAKSIDYFNDISEFPLDEKFGDFRHTWPEDAPIIDERDTMHKRGWTYFTVEGQLNGKEVTGTGRIPFIYDAVDDNWAWIELNIGDEIKIVDSDFGAYVADADGEVTISYPPKSLFKGLARPWFGMHAVDIVRRDAAEKKVRFSMENYGSDDYHYGKAKITLLTDESIVYTIDIDNDLIEKIEFPASETGSKNYLTFTHLQDIDNLSDEFEIPKKIRLPQNTRSQSPGMLWLTELSRGTLAK